jgi:dephospho-CoA kinase
MAKLIGLTGGIGSGKTTIANFFAEFGVPVYVADNEAKKLMDSDVIQKAVFDIFGPSVFQNNIIVRAKLAEIVFNDQKKLEKLNQIVHPAVRAHFKNWVQAHFHQEILLYESAILFESGQYKDFDYIISVTAPLESRIARVLERDNTSREAVLSRINAQWFDAERIAKSDFVIDNINLVDSKAKVAEILKFLKIKQNE